MSTITKAEFDQKVKEIEDYISKRLSQKQNMIKFPSESEELSKDLPADVLLAEAFGQLDHVVVTGIDKEGKWWFASSTTDDEKILWIIENFKTVLIESAPPRGFNGGREI